MSEAVGDHTEDAFLGGQLHLRQPRSGHRAGHDAILLAAATPARPGDRVVEFGAGIGAAGLALARRVAGIDLVLVEVDSRLASMASTNAAANGISAEIVVLDVTSAPRAFSSAGLSPDSVDAVLMNPPFNDPQNPSPEPRRRLARVASPATLPQWLRVASRLLRPSGTVTLIWRGDGVGDILAALAQGFGAVSLIPIHAKPGVPAVRVVACAAKGSRAPLALLPGLLLADAQGKPTPQAEAILREGAALPLAES